MPDHGVWYELVRGELRAMPLASGPHGLVTTTLLGMLWRHAVEHRVGRVFTPDTGVHLFREPDTVRAPDISFLSEARIPPEGIGRGFLRIAPDLAVEVLSPEDTMAEIEEKITDYFAAGTRLVWVVNPRARTVTVYRPDARPYVLGRHERLGGEEIVPGFSCQGEDIFAWIR